MSKAGDLALKIAVVIPWREYESRLPLKEYVHNWYLQNLPDAKIVYADSGHEIFNLSASRNLGAKKVLDYDVVIHNDADTVPYKESLLMGIVQTYNSGYFCNPYDHYKSFDIEETKKILNNSIPIEYAEYVKIGGACSGIVITTPKTWNKIGGFDENFKGWGYEDAAIAAAHSVLMDHEFLSIPGPAYSLGHVVSEKTPQLLGYNRKRVEKYLIAMTNKDKDLMNKLVKGVIR